MKYTKVIYGYKDIKPKIEQGEEIEGFRVTEDLIFEDKVEISVRQQPKEFMMLVSSLDNKPRCMVRFTADKDDKNFEKNTDYFLREFILSNKIKKTEFAK